MTPNWRHLWRYGGVMIRTTTFLRPLHVRCLTPAVLALGCVLSGCASGGSGNVMKDGVQTFTEGKSEVDRAFRAPFNTKDPVALTQGTGTLGPAAKPIDAAQLKAAIERHAEGRKQKAGTFVAAGAHLTPDGKLRALVLFTSENWCQPQGCDLAIFEQGTFGWKSVATISRVRAPVLVSSNVSSGWYELWAVTGREGKPVKDGKESKSFVQNVKLQYGANGYPGTTTFAISSTTGVPEGQAIIQSAELDLPGKARFATAGRDPDSKKKKSSLLKPAPAAPAAAAPAAAAAAPK
jgi:hypothetical protein